MRGVKYEEVNVLAACGFRSEGDESSWIAYRVWTGRKASVGMGPIRARTASARRCCSDAIAFIIELLNTGEYNDLRQSIVLPSVLVLSKTYSSLCTTGGFLHTCNTTRKSDQASLLFLAEE